MKEIQYLPVSYIIIIISLPPSKLETSSDWQTCKKKAGGGQRQ